MSEKIAVIGLGYVGLPLLVKLAEKGLDVIGFDIDARRINALNEGNDWTEETSHAELTKQKLNLTVKREDLEDRTFFIVTVPTPIDHAKRPDLGPVLGACKTIGAVLRQAKENRVEPEQTPLIVFESTVWPGLTEEYCGEEIEKASGLKTSVDFKLGYSPERINPGDKKNKLETIVKVISAEDDVCLDRLQAVYGTIITAGLHRAPNIKVAEAAKVLENTQRDLNIALMNELALICDRLDIRTRDVLAAAGTKWNFLKFTPGLVGGHCIGVDPYYLTARAEELGYQPQVILAGRRINDNMPSFIAQKILKLLAKSGRLHQKVRIGILGLTFKENVRDLRNSRVPDIIKELRDYNVEVLVHDPVVEPSHAKREYDLSLVGEGELENLDVLILAVPHDVFMTKINAFASKLVTEGIFVDIKSAVDPETLPAKTSYWSL